NASVADGVSGTFCAVSLSDERSGLLLLRHAGSKRLRRRRGRSGTVLPVAADEEIQGQDAHSRASPSSPAPDETPGPVPAHEYNGRKDSSPGRAVSPVRRPREDRDETSAGMEERHGHVAWPLASPCRP